MRSPIVFMLLGNGLALFCFLVFGLNFMRISRCAIPSRATLPALAVRGSYSRLVRVPNYSVPVVGKSKTMGFVRHALYSNLFAKVFGVHAPGLHYSESHD